MQTKLLFLGLCNTLRLHLCIPGDYYFGTYYILISNQDESEEESERYKEVGTFCIKNDILKIIVDL